MLLYSRRERCEPTESRAVSGHLAMSFVFYSQRAPSNDNLSTAYPDDVIDLLQEATPKEEDV
jgi:hypothetical protein